MEKNAVIASNPAGGRNVGFRIENPFALKVGQVFTGFGIGCGVGIGVGRPLNLGAIPVLQQVTSAARGATDAFSGVGRHVNSSLRSLGVKNIEVGLGCGVGFGHGFGVGLAIKPGVIHRLQSCFVQAMANLMMKFGVPGLSIGQGNLPDSFTRGMGMKNISSMQNPLGNVMPLALNTAELTSQGEPGKLNLDMGSTYKSFASKKTLQDTSFGSRTEKVISGFLQSPLLKDEGETDLNEVAGRLRSENNVLQMVLTGMEGGKEERQADGDFPEQPDKSMPSPQEEEEAVKKKYGGIVPKKPPLISKDHERAFFDSADWALGKQGTPVEKPKGPLEALRPKLQPTQQQSRSRRSSYAPSDGEDGGNSSEDATTNE